MTERSPAYPAGDNYVHELSGLVYTAENIPGPGSDPEDFSSRFELGCDCTTGNCSTDDCVCASRYGQSYTDDGRLLDGKRDGAIMECHTACRCRQNTSCGNRLVQYGPRDHLEVFVADEAKGFGLRSTKPIPSGSFICEYAGEVIGPDEARRRSGTQPTNYVFVLREHVGDSKIIRTCVDPSGIGNIGRYVNHSCEPNAAIVPVRVDNAVPRLAIFSVGDIRVGDEITFDYGGGGDAAVDATGQRKRCRCGAEACRGLLPFDADL